MIPWSGLTQNLCLWPPYIYLLRTRRSHTLQSDWSARHSPSQWCLGELDITMYHFAHQHGLVDAKGGHDITYPILTPPSVCLILGSGDSGTWCFFSWPSDFPSAPFILWLICLPSTLLTLPSLYEPLKNTFHPTSEIQASSHFNSGPPSSCWVFLRDLRNLRARA